MALGTRELFASADQDPLPRIHPYMNGTEVKTFANISGGPTLAVGTPLVNDAGEYRAWQDADADVLPIAGFVYPEAVVLHATNEVQGVVLTKGQIHFDDIVLPSGQTQNTLTAQLKNGPKEMGLDIQGLDGTGGHFTDPDT